MVDSPNITSILSAIQSELKAPKGQRNSFGNYNYRSCEDILEALKPLLAKHEAAILISDDVVHIDGRYYVKATARLIVGNIEISATAYAREPEQKKGADPSQITGAASSYARKYALYGLFAIDDTKDADSTNKHDKDSDMDANYQEACKELGDIIKSHGDEHYQSALNIWRGARSWQERASQLQSYLDSLEAKA